MIEIARNRIVINVVAVAALIFGPWWLVLLIGLWGLLIIPMYVEIFFLGIMLDMIGQGVSTDLLQLPWRHTLIAIVLGVLSIWVRPLFVGNR
jgi:hypothetical protein